MSAILSALPFLLILACPLMMIFMMKGMSGGMGGGHDKTGQSTVDPARDARIAELERQVVDLRKNEDKHVRSYPHAVNRQ